MFDFLSSITKLLSSGVSEVVSTGTEAVKKGVGFLDDNPLAKKLATSAASSIFATEEQTTPQQRKLPTLDYEPSKGVQVATPSVLQNPRLQLALSNLNNRVSTDSNLQRLVDDSFVRPTARRGRPTSPGSATIARTITAPKLTTSTSTRET
jgi:hypothetical protein